MTEVRRVKIVGNECIRHELHVTSQSDAILKIVGFAYRRKSVCRLSENNLHLSPQVRRKVV